MATDIRPRPTSAGLSKEAGASLVKRLESSWNGHSTAHRPKKLHEVFTKNFPISQRRTVNPALRNAAEAMKALERYNEYARQQLRWLDEVKQRLDADGTAGERMPCVSRRFPPRRLRAERRVVASTAPTAPMTMGPPPARGNLRGGNVVDRSRDPRLRGRM